jgi:hypothetical protein
MTPESVGARRRSYLAQPARLVATGAYVVILLLAGLVLDGRLPPPTIVGAWFTSGAIALILAGLLLEPFHTRPVDALLTGVALVFGAWTLSASDAVIPAVTIETGRLAFEVYGAFIVLASSGAILFKDQAGRRAALAGALTRFVSQAGRAVNVFSGVYLVCLYAAFATRPDRMLAGFLIWGVIVGLRPIEALLGAVRQRPRGLATIRALRDPRTAVVEMEPGNMPVLGASLSGRSITGLVVDTTQIAARGLVHLSITAASGLRTGQEVALTASPSPRELIGYVSEGSTVDELRVRVALGADASLAVGRVIFPLGEKDPVLHLVTSARLISELAGEVELERVELSARKLGRWDERSSSFRADRWVADSGAPACLQPLETAELDPMFIGVVPGTRFGVPVSVHHAVTYNTAILGILGAGKSTLAYQLIRRMIAEGVHVVVLDISRRYGPNFRDVFPLDFEQQIGEFITARVAKSANKQEVLPAVLDQFLQKDSRLLILDPSDLAREFQSIYRTPAALTRAVADALLTIARRDNPTDDPSMARYCLVLEEAHTLVPESSSTAEPEERNQVNGTARSILQGRKYGLGCLVVTQRTANVAKSILNQCNTVFAMRMYDNTGIDFLRNYLGSGFADLLPSLQQAQAVAFGTAIRRPERDLDPGVPIPLLVQVFDDGAFKARYWDPKVAGLPKPGSGRKDADDLEGAASDTPVTETALSGAADPVDELEVGVEPNSTEAVPGPEPLD